MQNSVIIMRNFETVKSAIRTFFFVFLILIKCANFTGLCGAAEISVITSSPDFCLPISNVLTARRQNFSMLVITWLFDSGVIYLSAFWTLACPGDKRARFLRSLSLVGKICQMYIVCYFLLVFFLVICSQI